MFVDKAVDLDQPDHVSYHELRPMSAPGQLEARLLLLEPDFGALVVIVGIAFGILFIGGLDGRLFFGLLLLLPVALGAVLVAAPYRLQRLVAFLDPWSDPYGKGYQLLTAALEAVEALED